jgi:hypothetical protein
MASGTTDGVTDGHVTYAASWLGTKMLSGNPNQVLIESNQSFLNRFAIHELNRNVDDNWVAQMKIEILKTKMAEECMTLTLAIDKRSIATALNEPDYNEEQGGFKAIILDGQHRFIAMKQLVQEMPSIKFNMWLIVYIVSSDAEIVSRLETLNKRRAFTKTDSDKVATLQRFLEAFQSIHHVENQTRRCIVKVRKSAILKSEKFTQKHKSTTVADFVDVLNKIAAKYKSSWEERGLPKNSVLYNVVHDTKLYQLCDEECNWLYEV